MISPEEIRAKAQRIYPRLLAAWAEGTDTELFPIRVPANLTPISGDVPATIKAVESLRNSCKQITGTGYTIDWKDVNSRDFGHNRFPAQLTIDTCKDLLVLAGKQRHFASTCEVAKQIRDQVPQLRTWVKANVRRLADLDSLADGLILVTKFFLAHPWPDCYARQVPLAVDTKFIERHQAILAEWLNEVLPASAIQADESKFPLRFGLRDGQPHLTLRVLDPLLQQELKLPWNEFSLPLRSLQTLAVQNAQVIIVENLLNLLTLPPVKRGLAIHGEGRAVTRLRALRWLADTDVFYWGDIDVEGFQILSSLRVYFPDIRSLMMNANVLKENSPQVLAGSGANSQEPPLLTPEEQAAFRQCFTHNHRLEQEQLPQRYVDQALVHQFGSYSSGD